MPPGLLVTGSKESALLHEMMEGYAALLRSSGVRVQTRDVPGECHFSVLSRLGDPGSEVHRLALGAIRGV
jgi:acetyl esterase/lipase